MKPIQHTFPSHLDLSLGQAFIGKRKREPRWAETPKATVSRVRLSAGYPVHTFRSLVNLVAWLTVNNTSYDLYYRGQGNDHKNKDGKTSIYPTICRPERKEDGSFKTSIQSVEVYKRYYELHNKFTEAFKQSKVTRTAAHYPEYYYAHFQHYNMFPTPLIDITQSLRVAATFALRQAQSGYLFVLGLPYSNGSISHFIDEEIVLIKLQNVSSVTALRPRYQEGFLVGKLPIEPPKTAGDNLARRMLGKYYLDNSKNTFWDDHFNAMPEDVLFPPEVPSF